MVTFFILHLSFDPLAIYLEFKNHCVLLTSYLLPYQIQIELQV